MTCVACMIHEICGFCAAFDVVLPAARVTAADARGPDGCACAAKRWVRAVAKSRRYEDFVDCTRLEPAFPAPFGVRKRRHQYTHTHTPTHTCTPVCAKSSKLPRVTKKVKKVTSFHSLSGFWFGRYATNADHGMGCNIHPAAKQYVSKRLATSALALHYKQQVRAP